MGIFTEGGTREAVPRLSQTALVMFISCCTLMIVNEAMISKTSVVIDIVTYDETQAFGLRGAQKAFLPKGLGLGYQTQPFCLLLQASSFTP